MGKYCKKPVVIDAVQFDGTEEQAKELGLKWLDGKIQDVTRGWTIKTLEGFHFGRPGDWLITGVKGEKYFCKPDIFEMTYEPAPTENQKKEK